MIIGEKVKKGYDRLIADKRKEIEKFTLDNQGVMLQYFRLQKELLELRQKRTDVAVKIAANLCKTKMNNENNSYKRK